MPRDKNRCIAVGKYRVTLVGLCYARDSNRLKCDYIFIYIDLRK